jgi:cyanophycinase
MRFHDLLGTLPARRIPAFLLAGALLWGCAPPVPVPLHEPAPEIQERRIGPANGTLLIAGGGPLGPEIWGRFLELAGGPDAGIVVIPTAGTDDVFPSDWPGLQGLRAAGARNVTVLHTRERDEANSEAFVQIIREASGVWFPGGRQWRLVDAYLGTRIHEELFGLLDRGGVIGGTSAGASIQASFLVRGDPATNTILVSPDYQVGFGFLSETAVDQHLLTRNRQEDLWELLELQPELLGIGLDEGTAIVVRGDTAEVIGTSRVILYDASGPRRESRTLGPGDVVDLRRGLSGVLAPELTDGGTSHHP